MTVVGESNTSWQTRMRNVAVCEEAARRRKAKRLVKAFGKAAAEMQQVRYDSYNMIGTPNMKAAVAEYKRTRANLLTFIESGGQ